MDTPFTSVNQLVSLLDLHTADDVIDSIAGKLHIADSTFPVEQVDFLDPDMTNGQIGYSMVSFQHRLWFPYRHEHPATTFKPEATKDHQCILYHDTESPVHSVSLLQSEHDLLVDSGSVIMTVGTSYIVTNYVTPSKNGIEMRSATGQIVKPQGKC
jgi:hypothetical protein